MKDKRGPIGRLLLAVTVLALASACGGGDAAEERPGSLTRDLLGAREQEASTGSPAPSLLREVPIDELGFDFGSADAPVRVMELSDYGCGYCRRFHLETWPTLRDEFVETGRVQWKLITYVTGMFDNSMAATRAAECVLEQSPEVFQRFTDRVWQDQAEWKGSGTPRELLRAWAGAAGADLEAYDTCMSSGRQLARVEASARLARDLGVRGTPTFVVVGYGPLQGALPLDTFRQVLLSVLEREELRTGG